MNSYPAYKPDDDSAIQELLRAIAVTVHYPYPGRVQLFELQYNHSYRLQLIDILHIFQEQISANCVSLAVTAGQVAGEQA